MRILCASIFCTLLLVSNVRSLLAQNFWGSTNGPFDDFGSYLNINVVAVTPDGKVFAGGDHDVYRSLDNGLTWKKTSFGLTGRATFCISFSPHYRIDNEIYVGGEGGIFHSVNNGDTWVRYPTTIGYIRSLAIDSNKTIFAALDDGIFSSTDAGITWTKKFPADHSTRAISSLTAVSGGTIVAGGYQGGIWVSTDEGNTWRISDSTGVSIWRSIAISKADSSFGFLFTNGGTMVLRSTDNGEHWSDISHQGPDEPITSIAINRLGYIYIGTQGRGVEVSTDGGMTWRYVNHGLADSSYSSLASSPVNDYLFAGTAQKSVIRSINSTSEVAAGGGSTPYILMQSILTKPMSAKNVIILNIPEPIYTSLRVYDVLGRVVSSLVDKFLEPGKVKLNFDASNLPIGYYFCILRLGSDTETKKFLLTN